MKWPWLQQLRLRASTIAGGGIFALSVLVFAMIFVKPELAENDLFKSLAQAVVIQGLIGLAMAFYFTAKDRPPDPVRGHAEADGEGG